MPDLAEIRRRIEAQHERYPWLVFEANRAVVVSTLNYYGLDWLATILGLASIYYLGRQRS